MGVVVWDSVDCAVTKVAREVEKRRAKHKFFFMAQIGV